MKFTILTKPFNYNNRTPRKPLSLDSLSKTIYVTHFTIKQGFNYHINYIHSYYHLFLIKSGRFYRRIKTHNRVDQIYKYNGILSINQ